MFVFSNGFETVESESLVLEDPSVAARITSRGTLKITERDGSVERVIFDASAAPVVIAPEVSSAPATSTAPEVSSVPTVGEIARALSTPDVAPTKAVSDFNGNLIIDSEAKARIEAQHETLKQAGVKLNTKEQLYATGTRMAQVGYDTQRARKAEHDASISIADAAHALETIVRDEKRYDREMSALDFARGLKVNGHVTCHDLKVSEQAIRGLLARIESPALSYVLGLRNRIAEAHAAETPDKTAMQADRDKIGEILAYECKRNPDVKLKLRTREAIGDIFATVSPSYVPADAPHVLAEIIEGMPRDAKGSFAYDPKSTTWELRAEVWTPTPVEEQAVGEAFRGYVSFQSRDNGTARFRGGGGIELLRCLNASTYVADGASVSRRHMGRVRYDIEKMVKDASKSIATLCRMWQSNRETEIEAPTGVPISQAIPGFWRHLLKNDRDLALVLPGRKENHVSGLTKAFFGEKRQPTGIFRADFAQGWTRYIQSQPGDVRRDAESAIGSWIVNARPLVYEASE